MERKRLKHIIIMLLAALVVTVAFFIGMSGARRKSPEVEILANNCYSDTLTVVMGDNFAPFSFESNGEYIGHDVELANEIANRLTKKWCGIFVTDYSFSDLRGVYPQLFLAAFIVLVATFALAALLVFRIRGEKEATRLNDQIDLQNQMIKRLIREYSEVYYVHMAEDKHDDTCQLLFKGGILTDDVLPPDEDLPFSNKLDYFINNIVLAEDREWVYSATRREVILEHIGGGDVYSVDFRVPQGELMHYYQIRFTRVEEHSEFRGFVIGLRLVDDQVRLSEQLAEQNAFTRYFFEPYISAYYVCIQDYSWQIYKRTDDLAKQYSVSESFSDSFSRYISTEVHPDDREAISVLLNPEKLKAMFSRQTSFRLPFRQISGNGIKHIQCEVTRGADEDHIALGFKDVTQEYLREQENAVTADLAKQQRSMKSFGDMVNAALWTIRISERDEVLDVIWSDEMRRMFGFEPTEEDFPNTVQAWASIIHPDDVDESRDVFYQSITSRDTGSIVYDSRYRIFRKNGECRWYRAVGRMEYNEDGTRNMYGIVYDTTEQVQLIEQKKQLEEQQSRLEDALSMAQSANRAKTAFLFNMSHDIRTPMNAILGFTDMAAKNIDDRDKLADYLDKTGQSGKLLLSLINSVLEMSRIEAGKAVLNETPGTVDASFRNIEATMLELAKKKDISLSFEIGSIEDNLVYADFDRSNRVFINLISNAIKYTNNGGRVSVSCEQAGRRDSDYGLYRYTFADNGIGMSEEFQSRLFDEFARENNSTESGVEGSGLGLSVVKYYVELMNGTIEFTSKQGKGTTFIVTLPFRLREDTTAAIEEEKPVQSIAASDCNLSGMRVLLVEDNEMNREIAAFILEEAGMLVEEAEDGTVAVEMLKEKGPDYYGAVLMDIQMPRMNGYEATKAIRAMYPDARLPIIAVSANAFAEDKAASLESGMNDHIAKPINTQELLSAIARLK